MDAGQLLNHLRRHRYTWRELHSRFGNVDVLICALLDAGAIIHEGPTGFDVRYKVLWPEERKLEVRK